jgi:flagellar hook-length control protein FliK
VEVTLSPPGIGKLEIEVVLDKGIVNANITAADPAGRDAITRSLPQILEALARDGMAIGGFTVSLKQRKDQAADAPAGRASGNAPARAAAPAAVSTGAAEPGHDDHIVYASTGLVDLFV